MKSLQQRILDFHPDRQEPTIHRKYELMSTDVFSLYRATCFLFYEDLATQPAINKGPLSWVCGDLHLENFGSYRASNGLVYFDINDFDEAMLAPCLWDVARFLCSIALASNDWKYSKKEGAELMQVALKEYAAHVRAQKPYAIERETSPSLIQQFFDMAEREREKDLIKARIDKKKERLQIIPDKTLELNKDRKQIVLQAVNAFLKQKNDSFKAVDVAFRIAGVGSLGIARYVVLVWDKKQEKWRLLDVKKSNPSSLQPHCNIRQPKWTSESERILQVQNLMQYASPRFMDTLKIEQNDFIIKQLQPSAHKIDHTLCGGKLINVAIVMTTMAEALASAQLRSAARLGSATVDELTEFVARNDWQKNLISLATEYAETTKGNFETFKAMYDQKDSPFKI
ncbi:MAG: DUF2252 family protein [Bacteroidetes bacterium]|nr:DUF2252 family protein [Bacteroidota bacterium]